MVNSFESTPVDPREIYRVGRKTGEELAYIEKPHRDRALSLAQRAIELNLPDDIKGIILKEANKITEDGKHAATKRENELWQEWRDAYYEDDMEGLEG